MFRVPRAADFSIECCSALRPSHWLLESSYPSQGGLHQTREPIRWPFSTHIASTSSFCSFQTAGLEPEPRFCHVQYSPTGNSGTQKHVPGASDHQQINDSQMEGKSLHTLCLSSFVPHLIDALPRVQLRVLEISYPTSFACATTEYHTLSTMPQYIGGLPISEDLIADDTFPPSYSLSTSPCSGLSVRLKFMPRRLLHPAPYTSNIVLICTLMCPPPSSLASAQAGI